VRNFPRTDNTAIVSSPVSSKVTGFKLARLGELDPGLRFGSWMVLNRTQLLPIKRHFKISFWLHIAAILYCI
jgi:hypothetical protein